MSRSRRVSSVGLLPAEGGQSRPGGGKRRGIRALTGLEKARLVVLSLFVGLLAGGCGPEPLSPAAARLLESGIAAYDQHLDDQAISELTTFIAEHRRTHRIDEAWYYRGLAYMRQGDYPGAKSDLINAVKATSKPHLLSNALVMLGDIAIEQDNPEEAMEWYSRALRYLARGLSPRDRVLYTMGDLAQHKGRWLEADRHFDQLIGDFSQFPGSAVYVARAAERTHGRCWTIRLGSFATRSDAVAMADRWGRDGLETYIWPDKTSAGLVFHVHAGRYDLHDDAARAAGKLPEDRPHQIVVCR